MSSMSALYNDVFTKSIDHFVFTTLTEGNLDTFYVAQFHKDHIEIDDYHDKDIHSHTLLLNGTAPSEDDIHWLNILSHDVNSGHFQDIHRIDDTTDHSLEDDVFHVVSESDLNIHFLSTDEINMIAGGIALLQMPAESLHRTGISYSPAKSLSSRFSDGFTRILRSIFGGAKKATPSEQNAIAESLKNHTLIRDYRSPEEKMSAKVESHRLKVKTSSQLKTKEIKALAERSIEHDEAFNISSYNDLKTLMSATKRSTHPEKVARFLSIYNEQVAPALTSEADALEYLSVKLAYLRLEEGNTIRLNITSTATDRASTYANDYKVVKRVVDTGEHGMVAYMLTPMTPDGKEDMTANPIVVFRGTATSMDKLAKAEGHGKGFKADLDKKGIGFESFEAFHNDIAPWMHEQFLTSGRRVSVMGHSLGGALASRSVCYLPSELQARTDLTTFQAPGIDHETAQMFDADNAKNVLHVMTSNDIVTRAGEAHLPTATNTVLSVKGSITGLKNNHLGTPGTKHKLDKGKDMTRHNVPIKAFKPRIIWESLRRFFSRFRSSVSA